MVEAAEFISGLRSALASIGSGVMAVDADVEPTPPSVTVVRVQYRDVDRRDRVDFWHLQLLARERGSEDPQALADYAARRMTSGLRVVSLNCDWGHEWPLWTGGGALLEPDDLGLSSGLTADLRSFADFWETHYAFDEGWDAPGDRASALEQAERLTSRLRAEVGGRCWVENGFRGSFS